MKKIFKKLLTSLLVITFSVQSGWAQGAVIAPLGGILLASDTVSLPLMRGLQFDPSELLNFNFVVDLADQEGISEDDALKLVRYFMAVLAVPDQDIWVNLSPDGKDRIIASNFGSTEAGQDLLSQDLLLKKISASFLHPDQELGQKFWDTAYAKIYQVYGMTEIPQDAFSRIWIVPQKAVIDEYKNAAYISESHLKVLMADEYESLKGLDQHGSSAIADDAHERISAIMKETVLPEIEKQVNEGEHFAVLRQIYQSMILAVWFKTKLKDHLVNRVYSDSSKTQGIDFADKNAEQETFESYLNIFRNGLYNEIREDYDPVTREMTLRKYVSGGFQILPDTDWMQTRKGDDVHRAMLSSTKNILLSVSLVLLGAASIFGQNDLKRVGTITPAHKPVIEQLQKYVTLNDVLSLNGQQNPMTHRTYNIDTNYIKSHWNDMWSTTTYGWAQEAVVVAAEHKLAEAGHTMVINGRVDQELRDALNQQIPNPQLPGGDGVDTLHHASSGGISQGGNDSDSLNVTSQSATDSVVQTRDTTFAIDTSTAKTIDSLGVALSPDSSATLKRVATDSTQSSGSAPPPPDQVRFSAYNNFTFPSAGGSLPFSSSNYHLSGISFTDNVVTVGANLEIWSHWNDSTSLTTVAPYWNLSYIHGRHWNFGAAYRSEAKGLTPVTIFTAKYFPTSQKYSFSSGLSIRHDWVEKHVEYYRSWMLSASGTLGKLFVQPSIYLTPEGTDWSLFASYSLSEKDFVYFERNAGDQNWLYGYKPQQPWTLGMSSRNRAGTTFKAYVASTAPYKITPQDLTMGLAFQYVLKKNLEKKTGKTDKAMFSRQSKEDIAKNGGVDLSATESATEIRAHGTFEGLKNMDVNLINPEVFNGFGVKMIRMVPIFDLSQIFVSDNGSVMLSQL